MINQNQNKDKKEKLEKALRENLLRRKVNNKRNKEKDLQKGEEN